MWSLLSSQLIKRSGAVHISTYTRPRSSITTSTSTSQEEKNLKKIRPWTLSNVWGHGSSSRSVNNRQRCDFRWGSRLCTHSQIDVFGQSKMRKITWFFNYFLPHCQQQAPKLQHIFSFTLRPNISPLSIPINLFQQWLISWACTERYSFLPPQDLTLHFYILPKTIKSALYILLYGFN